MDLGLDGARALVGGGSGGLGGAIAAELIAEGARVGIIGRPGARLDDASARLAALAVPADLSTPDGPRRGCRGGGPGLRWSRPPRRQLAAARRPGRFDDLDEAAWKTAIDGTLWSAIRVLRAALPHLREGRDPAILVILSSSAREPIAGLTTSNLIRPGLVGLIKSMVEEIVPVRINGLAPGRLATDRIAQLDAARSAASGDAGRGDPASEHRPDPARTVRRPAELGRVGAFLLSPAASYVTGAIVPVDGGMIRALP